MENLHDGLNDLYNRTLREAVTYGLPVIDLRLLFTAPEDYANGHYLPPWFEY